MYSDEVFEIIVDAARIEFDSVPPDPPGHFSSLRFDGYQRMVDCGALANDEYPDDLPSEEAISTFIREYPMFYMFGSVALDTSDEASVYITGIEFDGRAPNKRILDKADIEKTSYDTLKSEFFEHFGGAHRMEMSPEYFLADYCWDPPRG
jgi:hypothetical protein